MFFLFILSWLPGALRQQKLTITHGVSIGKGGVKFESQRYRKVAWLFGFGFHFQHFGLVVNNYP